jgi:hypothetical protein
MDDVEASMRTSGLRPPGEPPADADPFDVAMHYVRHWEGEFLRARLVVKKRASNVVVIVSSATALVAVLSAATAIAGLAWLGIVTAALAGLASVVSAWDGLFRHRELWMQRSLVLGRLQEVHRRAVFRLSLDPGERNTIASETMDELTRILADDQSAWTELRIKSSHSPSALEK